MKRALTILLLTTAALAADKTYQTGTLSLVTGPAATYTDSTSCYTGAAGDTHCGGGISQDVAVLYFLTLTDGRRISLSPVLWKHHNLDSFDCSRGPVPVPYRVVHHLNGTFYVIVGPDGREGTYYTEDKTR